MSETEVLAWSVEGTYFEACSCLPICPCRQVGGRDGGYRGYTTKSTPAAGRWRVNIETSDGLLIGRVPPLSLHACCGQAASPL